MHPVLYASKFILLFILFLSCQTGEQATEAYKNDSKNDPKGSNVPKNGVELIDLLMEKATIRATLSTEDQLKVRQIFEESFIAQHGDLNAPITPDNYLPYRKALFFGSRESLKKYMKEDKSFK